MTSILFVSSRLPYPLVTGAAQREMALLKALTDLGKTDLYLLRPPEEKDLHSLRLEVSLRDVGSSRASQVPGRPDTSRPAWYIPRSICGYAGREIADEYHVWKKARYDLVHLSSSHAFVALRRALKEERIVVDLYDIESVKVRRHWKHQEVPRNPFLMLKGWAGVKRELARWSVLHREICRGSDLVLTCSEVDRKLLHCRNGLVVPNGYTAPLRVAKQPHGGMLLLFQGLLTYGPNVEGISWFAEHVMPPLRRVYPGIGLRIVGKANADVQKLSVLQGVEVTGFVEDIVDEVEKAHVVVVPLRSGSGTRIKILEAFAYERPVVSTSIGAEGLEVENEKHLLIANSADEFVTQIGRLAEDGDLARKLTRKAKDLVSTRYNWTRIQEVFKAELRSRQIV